jgi:hypothetical protein
MWQMSFYERIQKTADKLLKGKGQTVTLTTQSSGTYDPATGSATVTTSTQYAYGAVFEYNTLQGGRYNGEETLIKEGDKQLLLSAYKTDGTALTAPVVNDTVTISGVVYTITRIKPLAPAGTTVIYDCNIRA